MIVTTKEIKAMLAIVDVIVESAEQISTHGISKNRWMTHIVIEIISKAENTKPETKEFLEYFALCFEIGRCSELSEEEKSKMIDCMRKNVKYGFGKWPEEEKNDG